MDPDSFTFNTQSTFFKKLDDLIVDASHGSTKSLEGIEQIILLNQPILADDQARLKLQSKVQKLNVVIEKSRNNLTTRNLAFKILTLAKAHPDSNQKEIKSWKDEPQSIWEIEKFKEALELDPEFTKNYTFEKTPDNAFSYLGRGREGIVYLAREVQSGKLMAIKVKCEREPQIHAYNGEEEVKAVELFSKATGYDFEAKNFTSFNAKSFIAGRTLQDLLTSNELLDGSVASQKILEKLQELLRSLIKARVFFTDVAPENFIYNGSKFYMVDLRPVDVYADVETTLNAYKEKILKGDIAWDQQRWFGNECTSVDKAKFLDFISKALTA